MYNLPLDGPELCVAETKAAIDDKKVEQCADGQLHRSRKGKGNCRKDQNQFCVSSRYLTNHNFELDATRTCRLFLHERN